MALLRPEEGLHPRNVLIQRLARVLILIGKKLPAGCLEITLDPSQNVEAFELNLASAEGVVRGGVKKKIGDNFEV